LNYEYSVWTQGHPPGGYRYIRIVAHSLIGAANGDEKLIGIAHNWLLSLLFFSRPFHVDLMPGAVDQFNVDMFEVLCRRVVNDWRGIGAGSAQHGALAAKKRNAVRETRNKFIAIRVSSTLLLRVASATSLGRALWPCYRCGNDRP
jgi:hypothetical protein